MESAASGIYFIHNEDDVRRRLRKVDLVLLDLDECVYPGITKLALLRNLCFVFFRAHRTEDIFPLFRLIIYFPLLALLKCLQLLHLGVDNRTLILFFSRMITGIPFSSLEEASISIPNGSVFGCKETLSVFIRKARIGIISLGLDIVMEEYRRQFTKGGTPLINFYEANRISWRIVNGVKVADGLSNQKQVLTGEDKGQLAERRIEEFQARVPLVIGHSEDDLPMMELAVRLGGLVIGINPCRKVWCISDLVVKNRDWRPLMTYLSNLAYQG